MYVATNSCPSFLNPPQVQKLDKWTLVQLVQLTCRSYYWGGQLERAWPTGNKYVHCLLHIDIISRFNSQSIFGLQKHVERVHSAQTPPECIIFFTGRLVRRTFSVHINFTTVICPDWGTESIFSFLFLLYVIQTPNIVLIKLWFDCLAVREVGKT